MENLPNIGRFRGQKRGKSGAYLLNLKPAIFVSLRGKNPLNNGSGVY